MPITQHYGHCVSEILHLFRSQLIIDFPFVHSKFVNDFLRGAVFLSFLSLHATDRHPPSRGALNKFKTFETQNVFTSPAKRDLVSFANTFIPEMSLLKANMGLVSLFIQTNISVNIKFVSFRQFGACHVTLDNHAIVWCLVWGQVSRGYIWPAQRNSQHCEKLTYCAELIIMPFLNSSFRSFRGKRTYHQLRT